MATMERREPVGPALEAVRPGAEAERERVKAGYAWGALRLALGWIFLWAFLDKLVGLGFATGRDPETGAIDFFGDAAWINGGSPTAGVLQFATKGPLADFYQGLAGGGWIDWVYMLSMLLIGLALILGVGVRLAAIGAVIWLGLFHSAVAIWPEFNPVLDDHLIYAVALIGVALVGAGRWLGLGKWWANAELVRRYPILE